MVRFSKGQVLDMAIAIENETNQILTFLSGFQMVLNKMASICPEFKWLASEFHAPFKIWIVQDKTSF